MTGLSFYEDGSIEIIEYYTTNEEFDLKWIDEEYKKHKITVHVMYEYIEKEIHSDKTTLEFKGKVKGFAVNDDYYNIWRKSKDKSFLEKLANDGSFEDFSLYQVKKEVEAIRDKFRKKIDEAIEERMEEEFVSEEEYLNQMKED